MGPVVERSFVAELLDRQIGLDLAPMLDDEAQRVGGLADDREIEPPFAEDRLGFLPPSRDRSTISMRSWLSESIIS